MKFSTTLGFFATIGLLVSGGLSAAQATTKSFDQTPAQCSAAVSDGDVVIEIPSSMTYTQVIVKVSGVPLDSGQFVTTDSQIRVNLEDAAGAIDVEWHDEEVTVAQCQAPQPPSASPTPMPSETESAHTEAPPPEPSQEPSEQPSASPSPGITTPAPTPTEVASPTPAVPAPPRPDTSSSPDTHDPMTTPDAPSVKAEAEVQPEQQRLSQSAPLDAQRGPRIIRSLPENPRYLLPQLFGLDTQQGSRLFLPHPRTAGEPRSELETLPPISEDELRALKAQLSIPDAAESSSTSAQLPTANLDTDSTRNLGWIFTGLAAIVAAVAAGWWLVGRRNREH